MARRRIRLTPLIEFLRTEAGGGIFLLAATVIAVVWANSPAGDFYDEFWHTHLTLGTAGGPLDHSLQEWINEGLMTLFFFVVGLEIKRELTQGELRKPRAALLPVIAALGGMIVPAAIYLALNAGTAAEAGWGIPMATDIAFVVGVLSLLDRRAPRSLRVFLLTLAIVDDIGAIVVIAVFYSSGVQPVWLLGGLALLGLVALMPHLGFRRVPWYVPVGLLIWIATLEAGVHATIAGVAIALFTPAHHVDGRPVLESLEHHLHPWSSYVVIPLFALANAGVSLSGDALTTAWGSLAAWGVTLGLLVGKPLGIVAFTGASVALGWTQLRGFRFSHLLGGGFLAGIGFTVSLFITALAFSDPELLTSVKIGVFAGSLTSGLGGAALLFMLGSPKRRALERAEATPTEE